MNSFFLALTAAAVWGLAAFCEKLGLTGGAALGGVLARSFGVFVGAAAYAALSPQARSGLATMGLKSFLFFCVGGILASVVGQIFFYQALKKGDMGQVASVGGSWPVFAFLLSLLFLNEAPTPKRLLGIALAIAGVSLVR